MLCQHVHETNFGVIHRCLDCKFYTEFCREMEAEEDAFFEELDRIVESEKSRWIIRAIFAVWL